MSALSHLASHLTLGDLLQAVQSHHHGYDLLAHWQQGEFHHDVVLRVHEQDSLPGPILVVATNCNGGVKELLCLSEPPERWGLWRHRCPDNPEFEGRVGEIRARVTTCHWFDPCELLRDDARSEYRPEARRRARGGGWEPRHE